MAKVNKSKKDNHGGVLQIPADLLRPIGTFFTSQLKNLERRKKDIEKDDPFTEGRAASLASPDTSANEQFGHARSVALKGEIDRKIIQMRKALSRVKIGKYGICEDCGTMIDTDRLVIYPEATLCTACERKKEK